jgi:hypothetical protein
VAAAVRSVALLTAANITLNMAYFLTHPVATPYYIMPIAMLSLWSALFAAVLQSRATSLAAVPQGADSQGEISRA